jgi:hypothetical protein
VHVFDSQSFQPGELAYVRRDFDPDGIRAVRCPVSGLTFGTALREQLPELLATLGDPGPAVYLLHGHDGARAWVREGVALDPGARIPQHWRDPDLATCHRISVFAGARLTEATAKIVECLLARQLGHVQAVDHRSRGAAMPCLEPADWQAGYAAVLHLRSLAPAIAIQFLEPTGRSDVASFRNCLEGYRAHGARTVVDLRRELLQDPRPLRGQLYQSTWGDYKAVAMQKDAHGWVLLAGSEIRRQAVESAPTSLGAGRARRGVHKRAAPVKGFPDRLLLHCDLTFGSRDALNKAFRGGGGRDRWKPLPGFGPSPGLSASREPRR